MDKLDNNIVVRVITGTAKGCLLEVPTKARAITDRAKSSLFSMIEPDIIEKKILDLYAGAGSLGIESLSRGAQSATFVDKSGIANSIIEKNLLKAKLLDKATIVCKDVNDFLAEQATNSFDIVFADPPFDFYDNTNMKLLNLMQEIEIIIPDGGAIILKHPKQLDFKKRDLAIPSTLKEVDSRKFGASTITIWVKIA